MPRDNLIRLLAENAWRLNTPDPRAGAADLVLLLEKELGPVPVALDATTAPQQVDFLSRQLEDLKADKATLQAQITTLTEERDAARDAGQQALEQLKKRKTADAVATLTDAAPAEEAAPAA